VAFRTYAGVCLLLTSRHVRPLEGRKGRLYSVHPLLELQDRFPLHSQPCMHLRIPLHCTLPDLLLSRIIACAHEGPLECLHSLLDMFTLLSCAWGGRGVDFL
jgi:hypothetical protein